MRLESSIVVRRTAEEVGISWKTSRTLRNGIMASAALRRFRAVREWHSNLKLSAVWIRRMPDVELADRYGYKHVSQRSLIMMDF